MQGKPLDLDDWYGHLDHLQSNIKHSKWCGICLLKGRPGVDIREPAICKDIEFHNLESEKDKAKAAKSGK